MVLLGQSEVCLSLNCLLMPNPSMGKLLSSILTVLSALSIYPLLVHSPHCHQNDVSKIKCDFVS